MPFACRVERHSVSPRGVGAVTFVITYPRVVLAETRTHRLASAESAVEYYEKSMGPDASMNSSSSRAVPVHRLLAAARDDPYMPDWGKAQAGMGEAGFLEGEAKRSADAVWLRYRDACVSAAEELAALGVQKGDANRTLEPVGWVTQAVTFDQYGLANFFTLRCDKAAHPAFRRIARMMYLAYRASKPDALDYGQWHLPFVPRDQALAFRWHGPLVPGGLVALADMPDLLRLSAGRCAWVSYDAHDGPGTQEKADATCRKLVEGAIKHASPLESQLTPLHYTWEASYPRYRSNISGWLQARKLLPGERAVEYNPSEEEVASWGLP